MLHGLFTLNNEGYANKIEVFENIADLKESFLNSDLICHIYYFNYDKQIFKKIMGVDDIERKFILEKNGMYYTSDYLELELEEHETKEELKEWAKNNKVELYNTKEELMDFYNNVSFI